MGIEPRALLMLRAPAEIAQSLERRDGTTGAYAHLLWLRHMIDAERATRGMMRATVDYGTLLEDWRRVVASVAPLAGRDGWVPDAEQAERIAGFLDPALRHHRATAPAALEEPLGEIVRAVEGGLHALLGRDDAEARAALDRAYALLDAAPWLEGDIIHDELRHRRAGTVPTRDAPAGTSAPVAPSQAADADLIRASGLFDIDWYLARYPDAAASGMEPIEHYLRIGGPRGYDPNPLFDTGFYARQMARRLPGAGGTR